MATKRRRRVTARLTRFGSCMRKKLKGRHFTSKRTARKALGSASRSCATKIRKKLVRRRSTKRRTSFRGETLFPGWG